MKVIVNDKDVTNLCTDYEWSGDILQRSRSLSVRYLYIKGKSSPQVEVVAGDSVALLDNAGKKIFLGIVISVDLSTKSSTASFMARDVLWYLTRNKVAAAYQDSPKAIAEKLLQEFSIDIDALPDESEIKSVVSTGEKTIYEVIQEAYGEDYYLYAEGEKIGVSRKAKDIVAVLSGTQNVLQVGYKASIEVMVNKVLILDDKGNPVGSVENAKDFVYGLLQETYKKEEKKDAQTEAKKLLKGMETGASVEALGDLRCIAGKGIYLVDTTLGCGLHYMIHDDKHKFSGGIHTMSLGLAFMEVGV